MEMQKRIHEKFVELYGEGGVAYASAGRVNLIGEHTDYNGGYVFPGAIDKGIVAEIKLNGTDKVNLYSLDYDAAASFGLNEEDKPQEAWASYVFGVCRETIKRGGKRSCAQQCQTYGNRRKPKKRKNSDRRAFHLDLRDC